MSTPDGRIDDIEVMEYALGGLGEKARARFEERLLEEQELREALERSVLVIDAASRHPRARGRSPLRYSAAAAALLVGILVWRASDSPPTPIAHQTPATVELEEVIETWLALGGGDAPEETDDADFVEADEGEIVPQWLKEGTSPR